MFKLKYSNGFNYLSVDKDDIENKSLSIADIPKYVRVFFGDYSDGGYIPMRGEAENSAFDAYRTTEEYNNNGVVYLENPITGAFEPVYIKKKLDDKGFAKISEASSTESSEAGDREKLLLNALDDDHLIDVDNIHHVTSNRVFFFAMQGLLAGFAFVSLYLTTYTSLTTEDILLNYQPMATEHRRLFYLLTTLSLTGNLTLLLDFRKSSGNSSPSERYKQKIYLLSMVTFIIFFLCFICMLIMSITETLIANKDGVTVPTDDIYVTGDGTWASYALSHDGYFNQTVVVWQSLSIVRFLLAFFGFIGSCITLWYEFISNFEVKEEVNDWMRKYSHSKQKVAELSGENLGELTFTELQSLLTLQKLACERTQEAITSYKTL